MSKPSSGQPFEIKSLADGLALQGQYWAPAKPIAIMSLVHGLGEHSGRYAELAEAMNSAGIAVVALDLRGHGNSAGKRGVCTEYKLLHGDLETLLEKSQGLYPDLPHFLYGHSLGGGLVLDYGRAPAPDIKGIIASAPFIALPTPTPAIIGHIANFLRRVFPAATLGQPLTGDKISTLPEEQKIYETDPLNHSRISFGLAVDAIRAGERVAAHASQWNTPLFLMHAKGDQLTSCEASEAFAKAAQNVTFRSYENSEHEMHHDTPKAKVFGEMIDFMKSRA
jgi:alpha-beta hydrolase superfamily lysophospholipase